MTMTPLRWIAPALAPLVLALPAAAQLSAVAANAMADMSIEDLANIEVTSVSKKPERLAAAAASVFVITADDIRRSGAATLPEALRLAPNLQVAQSSGYGYAISARGLNTSRNTVPNKLLVLIDGRSVYSPFFSGVTWDAQQVMLEDIERIEVISGPGGTLWGVNAVNGVINISTRAASATQGSLVALRAGQRGNHVAVRQGAGDWRVQASYLNERPTGLASGAPVNDARHQWQAGMRRDWGGGADQFSVVGIAYRGVLDQPEPGAITTGTKLDLGTVQSSGASLTAHWTRALAGGGSLMLQGYIDHSERDVPPTYAERIQVADLQFQHSLPAGGLGQLVWGANVRHTWDAVTNSETVAFLPAKVEQDWSSLFAQDELALRENLRLVLGARVEHNDYTGAEFLPSMRLAWQVAPQHALWSGVSRTVRAPSRLDADTYIPGKPPYLLRGGPQVRAEVAKVFELGYRGQPLAQLSYSATVFHNRYDYLRTQEYNVAGGFLTFDSKMEGKSSGIEMWGSYQATSWWRLNAGWMALHQRFALKAGSNDAPAPRTSGRDPSHTAQLRSTFTLSDDKELEVAVRKVARLDSDKVPGYRALDARLAWRVRRDMALSVSGNNLNGAHAEYGPLATRSDVPRDIAVKLVWMH
ncbi:TonB-dependent receptor plug domain-containing protein [Massilia genomosp. 1]|uniref:TonB-dependent receptor plug domain-containing protein n=1 Tax=Massilia genomosp. 1 TaxID=2609280 RepID=A0ABX0MRE7_9BURK|nr:TonB-dependent receptor [Massilia genomosp. 1]NHZ64991.1 TonB-dependent receptor plug domain-containing protein [Massilia genomosp. 1]